MTAQEQSLQDVTPELIIQRARDMIPFLQEQATHAQAERKIPDATIAKMHDAGFFRVLQPKRWGGYEMDPQVFFEVQMALAEGCMSTAWIYGVIAVHNWQIALFDLQAQEDVWRDDTSVLIASSYMPVGKVEPVDGGFKFSGRWAFSSGCDHCDWVFLGGVVPPTADNPNPDYRTFLVPRGDFKVMDTWHTFGLQGTGSNDIVVEDAFVPDYRTHSSLDGFRGTNPGIDSREIPLYKIPFGQLFPRAVSTSTIGATQGAINAYRDVASKRVGTNSGSKTAEDPQAQMAVARAQALVDQLKLRLMQTYDQLMADARQGQPTDLNLRIQYRYESAAVPEACLAEVLELQKMCGGRAIFTNSPLQRFVLDILAGRAHVANNPYQYGRNYGAIQLGLDNTDFFL
ncbi:MULTISPECIES: flavin-dependent monooxygenase [unclassified Ketobacter]|uniref:flavin-dependent monooxygenase n=1 Tax=unclassified Ketobacter TaxID=2639109 RepID=UPI000F2BFFAF|nr:MULTISPECIES: flavin-dependent monooxygenase [unclassified Ketobacter]RLT89395.1 MAG: flavin-dependent monooxygenase [Ketobacter sp. GenoA1]RLT95758.1 MAG: flavin-dependent monooxygenase [Ketobacter sp.]